MASASAKSELAQITKFDGSNFQLWKFSVSILLKAEKLMAVVDGSEAEPEDNTTAKWTAWDGKNARAQVILLTTITQDVIQCLVNCKNATEMWTKLLTIHEQKTELSRELIWQQFYEYRMSDGEKIASHIAKVESLVKQLKDVNETISDSAISSKIINSLPSKYNSFRTAWDSVAFADQTMANLTARLLKEETRMSQSDDEMSRLALQVENLRAKLDEKSRPSKAKRSIDEVKKMTKCNYCKEKGHWARECKKRLAKAEKTKDKSTNAGSSKTAYICDVSSLYTASSDQDQQTWICDSGATAHMTNQHGWFKNIEPLKEPIAIKIANNKIIAASGIGTIEIQALVHNEWHDRQMHNVLYVPELKRSLFSVGVLIDKNFTYHAFEKICEFRDEDGELSCTGVRKNKLWIMNFRIKPTDECFFVKKETLRLWHERFGHVNLRALRDAQKHKTVNGLSFESDEDFFCEKCQLGKQTRKPHHTSQRVKVNKIGEMIHTDVCGPMNVESPRGSRYFVLFKDDLSGYRTVFFMRHKSEVYEKFRAYKAMVETQTGNRIKRFRSDNGKEYVNKVFESFLKEHGIVHEFSAPYTPQQNGRAEREMRTIVESARSMLFNKNVPIELWAEAVSTAVYLLNRILSSENEGISAFEKWFKRKPEIKHLRVFGCTAYMSISPNFRRKWDAKSKKVLFVGYDGESRNYRLWDPEKRRIEVSCNVNFDEDGQFEKDPDKDLVNVPLFLGDYDVNDEDVVEEQDEDENDEENEEVENDNVRELRDRNLIRRPDYYGPAIYCSVLTPDTYQKAIEDENCEKWKSAMQEEFDALQKNQTWTLVPLPKNAKVIDNKWVFKIKTDMNGNATRYKARLVARGFSQTKNIDYTETFSPVVRYDSIRVLLALAAEQDLEFNHFDVQTAFLYGDLNESLYMKQPNGFQDKDKPNHVCLLKKSLYGLKQASRCWNKKFVDFLNSYKFKQLLSDQCVFVGDSNGHIIYLALYVDDGLVLSSSRFAIDSFLANLKEHFHITVDNGEQYVGLNIIRDRENGTITINQVPYIKRVLEKFNMGEAKPIQIPADPGVRLQRAEDSSGAENYPYREAVGSLIFLATVSRPDIAFGVNYVSRYLNKWSDEHVKAVKRIFRYLKGSVNLSITYRRINDVNLIGYSDADYAGCLDTRKSTSGFVFLLNGSPVTWSTQKQSVVAQSTTEAEYIALALATKEALWLRALLDELGFHQYSTRINVDNQSAIRLSKNPEFHKRSKHIDVKFHFVRDVCGRGDIDVKYVESKKQLADVFTKPLVTNIFKELIKYLLVSSDPE